MTDRWHSILTPTQRPGAIAVIMLRHPDPGEIGITRAQPGRLALCDLLGIDRGVVLGVDLQCWLLMPHGGMAIVRSISDRLTAMGIGMNPAPDPTAVYSEASSEIEAWCLHGLSTFPSPMAVDILLKHSRRWDELGIRTIECSAGVESMRDDCELARLMHPPTVAAVGRANVGKSSLINALVGQQVALVADIAGTTRDHVGVPLDLGGLVVRWIDTPGVDARTKDTEELTIAQRVLANAELVVHCIDSVDDPGVLDRRLSASIAPGVPVVRVGTRSDLGAHACPVDARVSVGKQPVGIASLVGMLRALLLPASVLEDPRPWRFWSVMGSG